MNLSPLSTLPVVPRTGAWYRAISPRFYPTQAFDLSYTANVASRFSAGSGAFQTLYLAQSPEIALREIQALYGPSGNTVPSLRAVTLFRVDVQLQRLVDLTNPAVQSLFQTTVQELTGDWQVYSALAALAAIPSLAPTAPTQQLGAALFASGVEGILSPSAKVPTASSLLVFQENLETGSYIRHTDPATGRVHQL